MNIKEMVEKSYASADAMQADMDEMNERGRENEKLGCAHFGIPYIIPYESPFMTREEFHEAVAKNMLGLLLKQEAANEQVERNTRK